MRYQVRCFQMTARPSIVSEHDWYFAAWLSAMWHAAFTPMAMIDIKETK